MTGHRPTRHLIHNALLCLDVDVKPGYVVCEDDRIAEVSTGTPDVAVFASCDTALDAERGWLLPGVIDTHVHLREPGLTHKGTIAGESLALVAGGVTSFLDMPNVMPTTVTLEALEDKQNRAERASMANYAFYVGATADNIDLLTHEVDYSRVPGVKAFLGSSTGGMLLDDERALRQLFAHVPALIAVHCEDEGIIRDNLRLARERHGDSVPTTMHPDIRSRQACLNCTRRAVALARELGTRLHVLHVSTADELALFTPGPVESKHITAEACVGHLWFDDTDYVRLGNRIKVNPSIKAAADRSALRAAVREGRIDVVSTDHAPHTADEKCQKYLNSPSGMPLAQFSLVTMMELVRQGCFGLQQVIDKMCHAPARLFGIAGRGYLRAGYQADMVLVHAVDTGYRIADDDVRSSCGWTPLAGTMLHHRVSRTWVNGVQVHPTPPRLTPARALIFDNKR